MTDGWETLLETSTGRLRVEYSQGRVIVHLKAFRWSVALIHALKRFTVEFDARMRAFGLRWVYAFYRDTEPKVGRLAAKFGFREIYRNGGFVLMKRSVPSA